jgi:hypothetical protein
MANWSGATQGPLLIDDEELPPASIDLMAENYRFKLSSRFAPVDPPFPRSLVPILLDPSHIPQSERTVHFKQEPNDVIPRYAQVFDFESAMGEYNEKQYEYQQFIISEAMRRCGPCPPKPKARSFTSQRTIQRISCERSTQKFPTAGITLPAKRPPAPRKNPPPVKPSVGESITISRVAVPDQRRRKTNKMVTHEVVVPQRTARREDSSNRKPRGEDQNRPEGRCTAKRYRSPPPRQPNGKWLQLSVKGGLGEYSEKVQQLGEVGAEPECSPSTTLAMF